MSAIQQGVLQLQVAVAYALAWKERVRGERSDAECGPSRRVIIVTRDIWGNLQQRTWAPEGAPVWRRIVPFRVLEGPRPW